MADDTPFVAYPYGRTMWSRNKMSAEAEADLDQFREWQASETDTPEKQQLFFARLRAAMEAVPPVPGSERDIIRYQPPVDPQPRASWVYYVRLLDRVKIGTTVNLKSRINSIPHDELLATEIGDFALEKQRHRQFQALRIRGEWFRYAEPLVSHVEALRGESA